MADKNGKTARAEAAREDEAPQPRTMTGAQAIVAALEDNGVELVFGYPGGTVLDIYDALRRSKRIKHILTRHEQAAVHAAEGYSRVGEVPGVVLVTSGPGSTNAVTGITNAYMDSMPLVVLAGQVATSAIGTDAFQEADFLGITLPVVKHSYLVTDPDELAPAVHEAFHIASTGRPGPVVICVPSDVAASEVVYGGKPERVSISSYKPTYKGNMRQIKQAASLAQKALRPVILAGGGVVASRAFSELKRLAETLQIPVAETLMARGCFPAEHFLHLGQAGMHGMPAANLAVAGCDLLIAVGTRFSNRVTDKASAYAKGAKVVHIDIDPAEIGKNIPVDVPIVGDAMLVLHELNAQLAKAGAVPVTESWLEQISEWRADRSIERPQDDPDTINAEEIVESLNAAVEASGREAIFTTEVGEHQMWASRMLVNSGPFTFVTSGGAGTMGFGFPAAMGVQFAHPDKLVVCLAGDGSIQMNIQEMATCAEQGLPVKLVIFNNAALGMVRQLQGVYYKKRYIATDLPRIPDYTLIAQAYGWQGESIEHPSELAAAMQRLVESDGPALLDVRMSHEELALPMVRQGHGLASMIGVSSASDKRRSHEEGGR